MTLCPICRTPFIPRRHRRTVKTCGAKACRHRQIGLSKRGRPQYRMRQTKRAQVNAKIRASLRSLFGELSIREIAVFQWAWKRAYRRGYDAARVGRQVQGC